MKLLVVTATAPQWKLATKVVIGEIVVGEAGADHVVHIKVLRCKLWDGMDCIVHNEKPA